VNQQINPIQRERRDDRATHKRFRRLLIKTDPQTRPARCERPERVEIKHCQAAECCEDEWIPFQRRRKVAVKKLNRAPGHAARDAWQTGDLMKSAAWPWQTERKPTNRDAERGKRRTQPQQFVIDFSPFQPPRDNLHSSVGRGVLKERQPAEHEEKEYAAATDNQRKQNRKHSAASIGFVGARQSDAGANERPNESDQSATNRDHLQRAGGALSESKDAKSGFK
jgi:hypothetical protein